MVFKFRYLINKIFYLGGFYPPVRIVKPDKFVNNLASKPIEIQEYYLKKISLYINSTHDTKYYNAILKALVPEWNKNITNAFFLKTKSMGESSLPTFRKINIANEITFEKVYFISYCDLKRVEWFQNHISDLILEKIKFPKMRDVFYSDTIAITYSDFLNLEIFTDEDQKFETIINFTKYLYQISVENSDYLDQLAIPEFILNYQNHFYISKFSAIARKKLEYKKIDYNFFILFANSSKHIISHGDIFETNVFANNTLVDWDNFGMFPIGFDVAFIYHRFIMKYNLIINLKEWLEENYWDVIDPNDWDVFTTNVCFFLYIYCAISFDNGKNLDLENFLLNHMKKTQRLE